MNESQNGSIVVFAMFVVAFVASMTTLIVSRARTDAQQTILERGHLQAFHAAEGALADIRVRLAENAQLESAAFEIGPCTVKATIVRVGEDWRVTVIATAKPRGEHDLPVNHRIEATLRGSGIPSVVRWRSGRR